VWCVGPANDRLPDPSGRACAKRPWKNLGKEASRAPRDIAIAIPVGEAQRAFLSDFTRLGYGLPRSRCA